MGLIVRLLERIGESTSWTKASMWWSLCQDASWRCYTEPAAWAMFLYQCFYLFYLLTSLILFVPFVYYPSKMSSPTLILPSIMLMSLRWNAEWSIFAVIISSEPMMHGLNGMNYQDNFYWRGQTASAIHLGVQQRRGQSPPCLKS